MIAQEFIHSSPMRPEQQASRNFSPTDPNSRVDVFMHQHIMKLLILSQGQATVKRGCSVKKEIETWNMDEDA